jgi:hypothetical protein
VWDRFPQVPPVPAPPPALPPSPAPLPQLVPADAPRGAPGRTVAFQKPPGGDVAQPKPGDATPPMPPVVAPPGPPTADPSEAARRAFGLESDDDLRRRIIQELIQEDLERRRRQKPPVPPQPQPPEYYQGPTQTPLVPAGTVYQPKTLTYPPIKSLVEPDFVVHRRLYFEEKNSERYGWDLGVLQPAFSTLHFYRDTLLWPSRLASNLFERYDTSAGKCYPGSPVPYYLYPPGVDLFGAAVGAGTIVGTAALFP